MEFNAFSGKAFCMSVCFPDGLLDIAIYLVCNYPVGFPACQENAGKKKEPAECINAHPQPPVKWVINLYYHHNFGIKPNHEIQYYQYHANPELYVLPPHHHSF